ncbi:MAG TPA: Crp/Fnr family transcriptional regulator [Bacteroidia bacterium]|nr:Crp/Fnr family transcriptional regulator [Bacteroidia bacterium]
MAHNNKNELPEEIFKDVFPISEKSFSGLKALFKYRSVGKNEIFAKVGQKNNSEYILLNGFCRSFLLNPEGNEITLTFFKKNDVLSPHITRTKSEISLLNFQALTDLELVEFDAGQFLLLMIENLEIRDFGNTILKNELMRKTEKEIALASHTAMERLIKFRDEFALLENLIPHPVIASYLGITNVSLSRLRGKVK